MTTNPGGSTTGPDWRGFHPALEDTLSFEEATKLAFVGVVESEGHQTFFRGDTYAGKETGVTFFHPKYSLPEGVRRQALVDTAFQGIDKDATAEALARLRARIDEDERRHQVYLAEKAAGF
jgi:hypothetical protein